MGEQRTKQHERQMQYWKLRGNEVSEFKMEWHGL